jgi:hypothetical protein
VNDPASQRRRHGDEHEHEHEHDDGASGHE